MSSSPRGATASKLVSRATRSRDIPAPCPSTARPAMGAAAVRAVGQPAARAARSRSGRSAIDRLIALERGAVVAGEHPRAVDEDAPAPEAGEQRLGLSQADERRVLPDALGPQLGGLGRLGLAVELEAGAGVDGLDLEPDRALRPDDERRAAATVGGERREDDAIAAPGEE